MPATPTTTAGPALLQRLRNAAASLYSQAEEKRNPAIASQRPTARRALIADGMARDGDRLERLGMLLDALADAHERGTIPAILAGITSRAALECVRDSYRFPDFRVSRHVLQRALERATEAPVVARCSVEAVLKAADPEEGAIFTTDDSIAHCEAILLAGTEEHYVGHLRERVRARNRLRKAGISTEAQLVAAKAALKALEAPASAPGPEQRVKELERALIGTKIEGYFPTPPAVVALLLEHADLQPGQRVLEPSAGKGNIADAIRQLPGIALDVVEWSGTLCAILEAKGYALAGRDFLQYQQAGYDRVVMNPPFEQMSDVDHILHAYDLLVPGGRLVSVASAGTFFHNTKKAADFRAWLDQLGAHYEKLPDGSFLNSERSTGVSTYIVVVDKPDA